MSDTCIVCLGDLSTGIDGVAATTSTSALSPGAETLGAPASASASALASLASTISAQVPAATNGHNNIPQLEEGELIAHLQPCGHDLHNECLKPWVERANSCPICRANFHLVELTHHIGGEVISSYPVQDKTQVADIDPSLFLENPDEEDVDEACQECGEGDNEDILMYCDGCGKLWHTYCVGLEEVPYASWFCDNCATDRTTDPNLRYLNRRTRNGPIRRRTRAMERRLRNHNATTDDGWNQVWQSVWSQLNLDLDFPFEDDDESPATMMRRHRQAVETNRREHEAWERRMRVAELVGAGNRFREIESTLLDTDMTQDRRNGGPRQPPQESAEEIAAWDAFHQARDEPTHSDPATSRKRRRKSRTTSPIQAQDSSNSPSRRAKRRRTTPPTAPAQQLPQPSSRSSPSRRISPTIRPHNALDNAAPSFLQSLLQEVQDSAGPSNVQIHRPSPRYPASPPGEQQSPRPSSPATSNPSSPRALSATPPPPMNGFRPSSPPGLSSSIQPVFPTAGYSPQRSVSPEPQRQHAETATKDTANRAPPTLKIARPKPRRPRIPTVAETSAARPRSTETSPTRTTLTADNKADVQKLVSAALRPLYHDQKISKDEYTTINRDVSRMLYDKVGDFEALDLEGKARWEKVAGDEVNKAVLALRV